MNDVRFPIETIREGNKITKICVEDVYKILNRIQDSMNKSFNKCVTLIDSVHKEIPNSADGKIWEGELIIGKGTSQPCLTDAFDEEIGNNLAFMKMKLNANIKKHNLICQIYNSWYDCLISINNELSKTDINILRDLDGIRKHNESYLTGIEEKLGIY